MTDSALRRPVGAWRASIGVLTAIAITTAMDATGLSAFSALPLCPLMLLFLRLERISWRDAGFVRACWRHYGLALFYPAVVPGLLAAVATVAGAVDLSGTDWRKALLNCALIAVSTFLVATITEEGFFRGWLWSSLERAGWGPDRVLVGSSVAFSLWHLSAVALDTGFDLPAARIPIFLVNAGLLGAAWGLMRALSGSLIVASVSHGLWNGIVYVLFGYGTKAGALGIREAWLYGPEVGVLGLALNAAFVALLWRVGARRSLVAGVSATG